MKTAISVEDTLMAQADQAARDLGLSRSGLISEALRLFLRQQRQRRITDQLNQVYSGELTTDEKRLLRGMKAKMPISESW